MDEQLPYNDHHDVPLPNEEESWQKMKALLDKEERRRWLPFLFWRFAATGLLLISLATAGYFLLRENKPTSPRAVSTTINKEQEQKQPLKKQEDETKRNIPPVVDAKRNDSKIETVQNNPTLEDEQISTAKTPMQKTEAIKAKPVSAKKLWQQKNNGQELPRSEKISERPIRQGENKTDIAPGKSSNTLPVTNNALQNKSDSTKQVPANATKGSIASDSAKSIAAPPVASTGVKKQKAKSKSSLSFSAGVGLEQAIAFNGQPAAYRDSTGKRKDFFDHLPSVYLRVQKGAWFVQGEFWYRVPQPVNSFSYSQTTSYDAPNNTLLTERLSVQKLYYRQAVFSLNRFLKKHWSLGIGGTYNLFAGVVAEREMKTKDAIGGSETITKNYVSAKGYTDSFLYKSTAGILLQTDYHWKRLSVGLRYTKNLQPFIKYTTPDGTVLNEKNGVLQAVLRLRLLN